MTKRGTFWSFESFQRDFKQVYELMCEKLWLKQEVQGKSFITNKDVSYYFEKLKEKIEEYEEHQSLNEALDIGNYVMMMIYHLSKEKK